MIIGLAGRAGSGKNHIATHHLVPLGFKDLALADEIKIRAVVTGVATYEEAFHTKPARVREWLQQEGTERGREQFGEDCWCLGLFARIQLMQERWDFADFVITDVRFPNEVRFIQERLGGQVFKIVAPTRVEQSHLTLEQRRHRSETMVDQLDPLVNAFLKNDPADAPYVGWQINNALHTMGYERTSHEVETPPLANRRDLVNQMYLR